MVLHLIGLGLGDARDISVRALDTVRRCATVYLESYTSLLPGVEVDDLSRLYGRPVLTADRYRVEQGLDNVVEQARDEDVALLVVGDPLAATTHQELLLQATRAGVECRVAHNASIVAAVACCGLQLYRFGETVSLPLWTTAWRPCSFVGRVLDNLARGLHTLCLLDIRVCEVSDDNLARGRCGEFEPPRFMSAAEAATQLLQAVQDSEQHTANVSELNAESRAVALARIGSATQRIVSSTLGEIGKLDMGGPLHSLVIVGQTHPLEDEFLLMHALPSNVTEIDKQHTDVQAEV